MRLCKNRARYCNTLLLTAGKLIRVLFQLFFDSEHLCNLCKKCFVRLPAVQPQRHTNVVQHGVLIQQIELLKHKAHAASAKDCHFFVREREHIHAVDKHFSGCRPVQSAQNMKQGGFSRSASSDYRIEKSLFNRKIDSVQCVHRSG